MAIILDVQRQIAFSPVIVFYLFVASMSAGLFILSTLGPVFHIKKMQPLAKPASVMALAGMIPALLLLIVDLGQPLRFYTLLFKFTPSSIMSWGTFILTFFSITCVLYIYFLWAENEKVSKRLGIIGFVLSIALGIYTGLAHALWDSALLTITFFIAGLVAAISLIVVFYAFFPKLAGFVSNELEETMVQQLRVWFIGLSIALFAVLSVILFASSQGSALFSHFVHGDRMISFVGITLVLGMALPLILFIFTKSKIGMGTGSVLSLVGIYFLRHNLMIGGQEMLSAGSMMRVPENASFELLLTSIFSVIAVVFILFLPKVVDIVLKKFNGHLDKKGTEEEKLAS